MFFTKMYFSKFIITYLVLIWNFIPDFTVLMKGSVILRHIFRKLEPSSEPQLLMKLLVIISYICNQTFINKSTLTPLLKISVQNFQTIFLESFLLLHQSSLSIFLFFTFNLLSRVPSRSC